MLAFRRQHHQEIATDLTDRDATERRITELYTKAVEQLGNDKAPVRLGGLYALERLAQDNPAHRQTIVNVICAYLRMPFSAAAPASKPEAAGDPGEHGAQPETTTHGDGDTWRQERQVRLTAQRILAEHLRDDRTPDQRSAGPRSPRFWPGIRLDLAGATLIDFSLNKGVVDGANFDGATFTGGVGFTGTTFNRDTTFDGATFSGDAWFSKATFSDAWFGKATFSLSAWFNGATFTGGVGFTRAIFSRNGAQFSGATFSGDHADFGGATFNGSAGFVGATFTGGTWFGAATFTGDARFDEVTVSGAKASLGFMGSRVLSPDDEHVWPTGWCLGPDGSGGYTIVRENGDGRFDLSATRADATADPSAGHAQ